MQVETLRDVLRWTKEFHIHLSRCLIHCSDKNTDERARIIIDYLSEHENGLTAALTGFERSGNDHALNTWCYEFINKQPIIQHVHCDTPFSELNADQVIEVIVDQHQQVIELYRYLSTRADIPSVKELLVALLSLEEHEIMRISQAANCFSDM